MSFARVASVVSHAAGSPYSFGLALTATVAWLATGPYFHWDDAWNFAANSSTTVITFLLVILIQNTQNRDARAIQAKLDELIRVNRKAHNALIGCEDREDNPP